MKQKTRIGTLSGIPLYLHWTFVVVPAYVLISGLLMGRPPFGIVADLTLVAAIFACVALHELGHALAARRYGVKTLDIVLMPIGGVARLERMPKRWWEEFVVALAGPAVNVVIALLLLAATLPVVGLSGLLTPQSLTASFLGKIVGVNIAMIVFNLLPAFPMDGGRVLRALLSSRVGHLRATRVAATVGQLMAVLFGLAGLFVFNNPALIFIAGFVYLGAAQEAAQAELEGSLDGLRVRDAMVIRFDSVPEHATAEWALRFAVSADQRQLPVVSTGRFLGIVRVEDLLSAVNDGHGSCLVSQLCHRDVPTLYGAQPLSAALDALRFSPDLFVPVVNTAGYLQGIVIRESIAYARKFGMQLRTVRQQPVPHNPDELRQHLTRLHV